MAAKNRQINSYERYGIFSADNTEFIINRPDTPRPWVNYLTNGRFCSIISQTAGGYHFYKDPTYNRLTRWRPENYIADLPGRYVYVRDNKTGEFWSATFSPVRKSSGFKCVHGLGYTSVYSEKSSIASEITFFVPPDEELEAWMVTLSNKRGKDADLTVFNFVEWHIGLWEPELAVRNIAVLINDVKYDNDLKAVVARKFPWGNKKWPYFCYMSANTKLDSYETDYEKFIGRYGDYSSPEEVKKGKCSNTDVRGLNSVGVISSRIKIKAGREKTYVVALGISESRSEARKIIKTYSDNNFVKQKLSETKQYWRKNICDNIVIETPDKELNRGVNIWMKYQIYINNYWGRSATYYHEGYGGFGYRNTAQDAWAMVPLNEKYARERIIKLAEHQWKTGQPMSGWSSEKGPDTGRPPSDFPIWLPFVLIAYLKETGDFKILDEEIKFFDGPKASLYEHAKRATRFLMDVAKSKRGLPLMGTQDWNDAFDRTGIGGKGESVWLGMGLCVALLNMIELADFIKDEKTKRECLSRYGKMKKIINKYAWDGKWYIYAFNDYGKPIGSRKNGEGKIQLNAQTWAILAGLPDRKQLKKILKVIDNDLDTEYGPALFTPPYTKYDPTIGRITAFAPGTKENAAIFCHGGAFKSVSDLAIGRSDEAYDTIKKLLPQNPGRDIEIYKTEPYCFSEYLVGPGNSRFGEGAFTWLTGSVDWVFKAVTEWMLGIRPEFDGLRIAPCLPREWKKCRIIRPFRGAVYDIEIFRLAGKTGKIKIEIDGKNQLSNVIIPRGDAKRHRVKVTLG
ncbi:MAG: hypothetical protein PHO00_07765 [bacterium]|nr:hypothetical protein [bacterium]